MVSMIMCAFSANT